MFRKIFLLSILTFSFSYAVDEIDIEKRRQEQQDFDTLIKSQDFSVPENNKGNEQKNLILKNSFSFLPLIIFIYFIFLLGRTNSFFLSKISYFTLNHMIHNFFCNLIKNFSKSIYCYCYFSVNFMCFF